MEKILLSTVNKDEQRIAVLSNGVISDYLSLIPGHEDRKGSIYRGEVAIIEPSLDACFVEIGDEKKGFLRFSEIDKAYLGDAGNQSGAKVSDSLKPGTPVLVKIVKDSRGEKGPLLSTRIDLTSSNLVLMPFASDAGIRISRRADDNDRERLMSELDRLKLPAGMGLIIRSNGTDKPISELEWQLSSYLLPFWSKIQEIFNKLDEPGLIYEDHNIVNTCLSEYFSPKIAELVCDEEETMQEAKESVAVFMPAMIDHVRMAQENESIFDERIQAQLDALMSRKVTLPSGGELVIDITEALIAIDINSKRSRSQSGIEKTAYQTNLEAATEIARQIRLRNLSGLIVIDFIDMEEEGNKESLVQHMRRCVRSDKAQIAISEISRFGLMEMTRQNIGRPLHEAHAEICKACQGIGRLPTVSSFARNILDKIRETCLARKQTGSIVLQLPADAATYLLNEQRRQLLALQDDMQIELIILPSYSMNIPEHRIRVEKATKQPKSSKISYEMDTGIKLEQESYLGESKKQHKYSPPAISSFKVSQPRQQAKTQESDNDSLITRIAKLFSGGGRPTETEKNSAASNARGENQSSKAKGRGGRRRGEGKNRRKGSSAKEAFGNKQNRRQSDSRHKKSDNQDREKRSSSAQRPAKPKQDQPNKSRPANDGKQLATQEKQASRPSTDSAPNHESNRHESQPSTPARQANDARNASETQDKQPSGSPSPAKQSKTGNGETEMAKQARTRDPGNSLRRNKAESQSSPPASPST